MAGKFQFMCFELKTVQGPPFLKVTFVTWFLVPERAQVSWMDFSDIGHVSVRAQKTGSVF